MGSPSLRARTTRASLGHARPSLATNVPESLSSWLKARMKAALRSKSSFDHFAKESQFSFGALIIRMNFIFRLSRFTRRVLREPADFDRHVGGNAAGSGRGRNPARDGVSALGIGDIDDPVAEQKLL